MSGCAVCVYDLYEEALAAYKDSVTTLRAALSARQIPEAQWPAHIRTGNATHTVTEKSKGAVLDAFEEMERALKEKRGKRAAVETESSS
jgi:predicted DNA-binding transcriptional regulator